jgi:archaellin
MNNRAETGTLILLIALILVVSITVTVLIQATSTAQKTAEQKGKSTTQTMSSYITIVHGSATDGTGVIDTLTFTIKPAAASQTIDFASTALFLDMEERSALYRYSDSVTVNSTNSTGTYTVTYLEEGPHHKPGALSRGDLVAITLQAPRPLQQKEDFHLKIYPVNGLPTVLGFSLPMTITQQRVHLYP